MAWTNGEMTRVPFYGEKNTRGQEKVTVQVPMFREVFCSAKPEFYGAKTHVNAFSVHREAVTFTAREQ